VAEQKKNVHRGLKRLICGALQERGERGEKSRCDEEPAENDYLIAWGDSDAQSIDRKIAKIESALKKDGAGYPYRRGSAKFRQEHLCNQWLNLEEEKCSQGYLESDE
jgi:hypothetical protein